MAYVTVEKDASKQVRLYYEDFGQGKPVVMIHGWPMNHEMWEYQQAAIVGSGHRYIAYDRRGFGKSDKPWDGYNYDQFTSDLHALINELDLHDVTLVGFSMGGGEVVRYLNNHGPDRIEKVVLISSVVPYLLQTPDNEEGVPKSEFDGMVESIKKDRPAFLKDFGKQFYGVNAVKKPVSAELLEWSHLCTLYASPKGTVDCIRAFSETDFRKDLPAVTVPTLIIHGDADKIVPINISSDISSKLIATSQYIVYEGAPHGLFITDAEKLNQDLVQFLSR